jgi:hypothetical protein
MGYTERDDLPVGPVSLVTALGLGLLHDAAHPAAPRLRPGRVLRTGARHDHGRLRRPPRRARRDPGAGPRARDDPRRRPAPLVAAPGARGRMEVVLLPVGHSPLGSAMVAAHSGAVAGGSGSWEALADDVAGHLVADLAELGDTLAVLSSTRRPRPGTGIATVHDSGAERSLVADLAHSLDVASPSSARHPRGPGRPPRRGLVARTPWTSGVGAPTPTGSSPTASPRWPPTRRSG